MPAGVIDYEEFVKEAPSCVEIKNYYGAFVLNRRVDLHAIDVTARPMLVDFHTGAQNPEDEPRQARQKQRRGAGLPELARSRTINPRPPRGSDLGPPASVEKFLETSVVLYNSKLDIA